MSKRLNDEQRKLVEDNHNLIYAFLNSNNLSIDEYYDLAAIGICKAALSYKEDVSKFSTFAYKCMWNQVMIEKRKQSAIRRADDKAVLYYEEMFNCNFDGDECCFLSLLPDFKYDTEKQAEIRHWLYDIYRTLNEKEALMFKLLIRGYKQKEVCRIVGCAQPTVSRFRNKLKNRYDGVRL